MAKVFLRLFYIVLAAALAVAVFIFLVFLPNFRAIVFVFGDPAAAFGSKIGFLVYLILGITDSLSFFAIANTAVVSILFGVNIALIVYLLRERLIGFGGKAIIASLGGGGFGVLSAGCAVCGSFVLSAVLSGLGAGGALALLPLRGGEFGILSVLLLAVSIYITSRKINTPAVCE